MTDLSRLEPKNGDFVRYVDDLIRRQQAEMLRTRGDEAAAMRASLRDAFDANGAPPPGRAGGGAEHIVGGRGGGQPPKRPVQPMLPENTRLNRQRREACRRSALKKHLLAKAAHFRKSSSLSALPPLQPFSVRSS